MCSKVLGCSVVALTFKLSKPKYRQTLKTLMKVRAWLAKLGWMYVLQLLLEHHMAHWLKVREHHIKKIRRKCDRYKNRLHMLMQKAHVGNEQVSNDGTA